MSEANKFPSRRFPFFGCWIQDAVQTRYIAALLKAMSFSKMKKSIIPAGTAKLTQGTNQVAQTIALDQAQMSVHRKSTLVTTLSQVLALEESIYVRMYR